MLELPKWSARLSAARPYPEYTDLLELVAKHYHVYSSAESFLAPYNAKQRSRPFYAPPDRDVLRGSIRKMGMNDFTYSAFLNSLVRFCETTKGNRALPTPHPSVIHSIQLPEPAFEFVPVTDEGTIGTHKLVMPGVEPLFVQGVRRPETVKFIIVRPKLSKLGTASAKEWEVLLFNQNHGYIPHWVDSNLNPRWSGII